ncbi:peptidase domain-containing ABC transporter [Verticiella sediminum]|uniref:Cyclolysin secretion/processing ATP-binding protein CyaB n=1 Tax=Verticiella sediminum TaxID=1247510 RepID=A0A556A6J6_9BURK|nr:peptidase domain-containing ABC transporter [Verticiella sediminum]TSH88492.1 peptidase domain-containing ABC transporter [Verticiella sediminum]
MDHRLSFGLGRKLPLVLQAEAAECGLACLAMIAGYHGHHTDLMTLRRRFALSLKGATLAHLIQVAGGLGLASRPLKLDLEHLDQLRLPCLLHWDFNHFVVLKEVGPRSVVIHDPASGIRTCSLAEVSRSFTGVALELWPGPEFRREENRQRMRLRQLMGRAHGLLRSLGQVLLLALALEIFTIVSPFFLQWVIDNVLVSGDRDLLTTLAIGFGLLMLMQQAVSFVRGWALMYLGTSLSMQWRINVFSHLLRLPVAYFEKRHLGDVVSRFGSVDTIQRTLTTSFLEALLDGVMVLATLLLMFLYSSLLAWIAVAAMALYALARWVWYAPMRHATEEHIVHAARQQTHFLETVRGIKTVKLFMRQEERRASWIALLVDQLNADLRTQKMTLLYRAVNGLAVGIENILIIWLGARLVLEGNFTVGMLMAFVAYKTQFSTRTAALVDKLVEVKMLQLQGERLADIVFTAPEETAAAEPPAEHGPPPSLEVRNLRFRYSEQEPWILDGVSFRIEPGQSVAIAGPSGGGKTTLLNVLLGVLPPTEGEVLLDGHDVRRLGLDALRRITGTVLQDDVLFAGSIGENISFFDAAPDRARIETCARLAAVHADIAAMPMGYNTLVGDMGTVLSGGQKQRILLARALYKQPRLLFLDEATSHLDLAREAQVNAAVGGLDMTCIIVAHRPETIRSAQRVLVLVDGRIRHEQDGAGMTPAPAAKAVP